jgi:hypothetical protein
MVFVRAHLVVDRTAPGGRVTIGTGKALAMLPQLPSDDVASGGTILEPSSAPLPIGIKPNAVPPLKLDTAVAVAASAGFQLPVVGRTPDGSDVSEESTPRMAPSAPPTPTAGVSPRSSTLAYGYRFRVRTPVFVRPITSLCADQNCFTQWACGACGPCFDTARRSHTGPVFPNRRGVIKDCEALRRSFGTHRTTCYTTSRQR